METDKYSHATDKADLLDSDGENLAGKEVPHRARPISGLNRKANHRPNDRQHMAQFIPLLADVFPDFGKGTHEWRMLSQLVRTSLTAEMWEERQSALSFQGMGCTAAQPHTPQQTVRSVVD